MIVRFLFNFRSLPRTFLGRSIGIKRNFNLAHEMKLLNDTKQFKKTLELFDKHTTGQVGELSSSVISQALKACMHTKDLHRGLTIHSSITSRAKDDKYISTSLINMYADCCDMVNAQSVLDAAKEKTPSVYGIMMKGYINNNQPKKAMDLFHEIKQPDSVNIILLFNACALLRTNEALNLVKSVSKKIPKSFFSNPRLFTSLLDALMKCGDIEYAESLFNMSNEKSLHSYGAMMKGYVDNNAAEKAIALFREITTPNDVHIILFLNACALLRTNEALNLVKSVSKKIPKSFFSNPRVFTSLLDAIMKCGDIEYAESLFNMSNEKSLHSYGAMMKGYVDNNAAEKAIALFREITTPNDVHIILFLNACALLRTNEALNLVKSVSKKIEKSFFSNPHLFTSLLDALMKCGDMEYAESLFNTSNKKSSSSYATMIAGFIKENDHLKALNLFNLMKLNGVEITIGIYLCALKAVSQIGDYSLAESIVRQIPDSFLVDIRIQSSIIDVWGKVGSVNEAKQVFDRIREPNQIVYTTMINSYGLNGMGIQAVELFRLMPEEFLHEAAYVCVLNACSHSGLIDEARVIFKNIQLKTNKIYTTMIDCLSRASNFDNAQGLIDEYERHHSPDPGMYTALLSGARNVNNTYLSHNIYDRMTTIFPQMKNALISAAVLLANTYASSGEDKKASDIRWELSKSGAKKKVGVTWTAVNGQLYGFRAHDRSHPRSTEIYAEIEKLSSQLIENGHEYDSSWITRPLDPEETVESVLCGHSERLAIAWNFVVNPNVSRIQITKNLRICGDCHRATKLIAIIRQCEIIARDANRIHHFYKNGQCSCNDYF